jgi:Predicted GTPase
LENYSKVRKHLYKYSNKLVKKREIIVFNKIDMLDEKEINKKLDVFKKKIKKKVFTISALKHIGLKIIKENIFSHANR